MALDMATINKTRPNCARVKVLTNLLADRPKKVRMDIENESIGTVRMQWVKIQYDCIPKYCKECRLQGHNEEECSKLHPELVPVVDKQGDGGVAQGGGRKGNEQQLKILSSGKIVGNVGKNWREVRDNRVKNNANQENNQGKTRKEIVPIHQGIRQ